MDTETTEEGEETCGVGTRTIVKCNGNSVGDTASGDDTGIRLDVLEPGIGRSVGGRGTGMTKSASTEFGIAAGGEGTMVLGDTTPAVLGATEAGTTATVGRAALLLSERDGDEKGKKNQQRLKQGASGFEA